MSPIVPYFEVILANGDLFKFGNVYNNNEPVMTDKDEFVYTYTDMFHTKRYKVVLTNNTLRDALRSMTSWDSEQNISFHWYVDPAVQMNNWTVEMLLETIIGHHPPLRIQVSRNP